MLNIHELTQNEQDKWFDDINAEYIAAVNELLDDGEAVASENEDGVAFSQALKVAERDLQLSVEFFAGEYTWFVGRFFTAMTRECAGETIFGILQTA